jgi:hypothetical protein
MSIISGAGWQARFRDEAGDESTRPIVVWQEDGDGDVVGLVTPRGDGRLYLAPVGAIRGFVGYERADHSDVDELREIVASIDSLSESVLTLRLAIVQQ